MEVVFPAFLIFALVMAGMSIGVVLSGRCIKGSCGGVGGDCQCLGAGDHQCEREGDQASAALV
ncbi:ApbE family protein, partial [Candidatus Latescibacterota bacterium]